jgi:hypothetical protein
VPCLAPSLFYFPLLLLLFFPPHSDPGIRYPLHTSFACLFSSRANLRPSLLLCHAETQGMQTYVTILQSQKLLLQPVCGTGRPQHEGTKKCKCCPPPHSFPDGQCQWLWSRSSGFFVSISISVGHGIESVSR